ncbi:response regulator [Actinoplanes sp. NEAU-A12]|uniref:Response regulator n=1 Tax=Actinoplanes sandaracinus TaxID=3045177 RepID=A0ABT6WJS0_9ACTN|nr:response regulator [Actinoplanes sandaracinus]MDI6099905.1 response regulator [Actinoplanes sandaracinus]
MSEAPDAERPTVLVVDDEEDLRDIMRRMLERRGFTTLSAGEPEEAVAICRDQPGPIDVLITDLTLPGASGGELAKTIRGLRPGIGVVFVSGLPKDIAVGKGEITEDDVLVKKPFTADALLEALRAALDEKKKREG